MFGNNKNEPIRSTPSPSPGKGNEARINKIASGTVVVGDVNAEGDFRVEGKVIGNLVCSSRLVVSETGYIEGTVDAKNITVEGEIRGNVITREILQIDKTGKIYGDVFTQKLVVQVGAVFTGNSYMSEAAKEVLSKAPQKSKDLLEKVSETGGGKAIANGISVSSSSDKNKSSEVAATVSKN